MANVFTSNNFRVAAATPFAAVAAGAAFVAEASVLVGKKVAGEKNWDNVPFSGYVNKHTAGFVFNAPSAEEALKMAEAKRVERADHSDMVEWKRGRWVPSEKATAAAKKAGHEQAFLPQMYKAANWIIRVAKEGGDKVYSTTQGETHTYLGWVFKAIYGHAAFMEGKGVKNAKSPEKLAEYFEQACKHSKVEADKLPTWEQVCIAVQAEQKLAKEGAEVVEGEVVETAEAGEVRDGRAPKTTAKGKVNVKSIVRALGEMHLKADNAFEVAEKAKAAFEEDRLTDEEFRVVLEACITKDGGDPEEFYSLMGEN